MAFTFFFRDNHTLTRLTKTFIDSTAGLRKTKVWDAGCANGSEPYTFAVILAESMNEQAFMNVEIIASDLDETNTFGDMVRKAKYSENDLQRIPRDIFGKYFIKSKENGYFDLVNSVKSRVRFIRHDLLTLEPVDKDLSLIICKNVLLHLLPKERVEVIKMFHSALLPNGLFVTEQTQQMPYETRHLFEKTASDAQVYRKIKID